MDATMPLNLQLREGIASVSVRRYLSHRPSRENNSPLRAATASEIVWELG